MVEGAFSQVSTYDEIALRAAPAEGAAPGEISVCVYTRLPFPRDAAAPAPRADSPPELGGLPLAGEERIALRGRGDASLRAPLQGEIARALAALLRARLPDERPVRVWWSSEAPELEDVPWEILALGEHRPPRSSLVRGIPRGSAPPLPIPPGQPLRVALFDPAGLAPASLVDALAAMGPEVRAERLDERDPREALGAAVRAGFEVIHLIAGASVPLGVEGLLDFPGDATLTPPEISALLRRSRAVVLALGAPPEVRAERGFTRVARGIEEGPSIVAPIAPVSIEETARFFGAFYPRLAASLDAEDALAFAAPSPNRAPFALHLRQRFGRQLVRSEPGPGDVVFDPGGANTRPALADVCADLAIAGKLLDAARALERRYAASGRAFPGAGLLDRERDRQRGLAAYLDAALRRERDR